jgi:hypothetical protein
VSTMPGQSDANQQIEQARRQIQRLAEEIAHLAESDLSPPNFYSEFLQRVLQALAAPAGAVWLLTQQGNLQQQCQINVRDVGLDSSDEARAVHDELLRQALLRGQPFMMPPRSSTGQAEGNRPAPGNPTSYQILLAPIQLEKQVTGLVEIWQDPTRSPAAQQGFLEFLVRMARLASGFTRNHQLRQMVGQQQVWTQLESFARQIHNSLQPTEVSYLVANEGRRLAECDRISVGIRMGKKTKVEAISGADIVEKRSNLVQLMRTLLDTVLVWGEKLVYTGTKDDTLPPDVLKALDEYLAEATSKFLVVLPLRDDRETDKKRTPRSALLMESFEPTLPTEQMIARLEVIGKHATTALYNATEYKRIPGQFIWLPLAKLQEGLGGKAKAITWGVSGGLLVLALVMIFVPYPLKMGADGQVWPVKRPFIYPPVPCEVEHFAHGIKSGSRVSKDQELIEIYAPDLASSIIELTKDIGGLEAQKSSIQANLQSDLRSGDVSQKLKMIEVESALEGKKARLDNYRRKFKIDANTPGRIWLRSPIDGVVLTPDFEKLTGMGVKETTPLLRIGGVHPQPSKNKVSDWEIELRIPQKHIGQVLMAVEKLKPGEDLDVDIVLKSTPTRSFKGKLARNKIASEATPNKDDNNESEPVTLAWVRVHGDDIPEAYRLSPENLLAGVQARTNIRCGNRAMGYSLFYPVWELLYEYVIFRLF